MNVITWAPHNHTDLKELYFYYVINCVNFEYMSLDRTEQLIGLFAPEMNDWQVATEVTAAFPIPQFSDKTNIHANCAHVQRNCRLSTKRQNELFSEVWKLFSQSCTHVPAQLPSAMLPRQARGTCKKQLA